MNINDKYKNKITACVNLIELLGFSKDNILQKYLNKNFEEESILKHNVFSEVLNLKLTNNSYNFLDRKCSNLAYFKDSRENYEYGIDLILGWMIEDTVLYRLKQDDVMSALDGKDRYREFLPARKISTQPDLLIGKVNHRSLEIFCDWTNIWIEKKHADFRDNKFLKLNEKKSLILGLSPISSQGFLLDLPKHNKYFEKVATIPGYGGKPGYSIKKITEFIKPLDKVIEELVAVSKKLI